MSSKEIDRKKTFKKGIDADEGRRRREETSIALRKAKKEQHISKRRQMQVPFNAMSAGDDAGMSMDASGEAVFLESSFVQSSKHENADSEDDYRIPPEDDERKEEVACKETTGDTRRSQWFTSPFQYVTRSSSSSR
mmetsp:Transcript_17987/g.25631  ORF Transcript_17987/g.25631 Transcript_17987/m.25631 type:complete len:136 (+) Transcript_17987:51-458(+)